MKIVIVVLVWRVCSIESHDIVILIFHPDSSLESHAGGIVFRLYVDYQAADIAQKFAAYEREFVKLALQIFVQQNHLRETKGQKFIP